MKTSIVIVHFADPLVTNQCIESIYNARLDFDQIIVVDNNQNFFLSNKLKLKKEILLIVNKKNLGFAAGVNVGIKKALSKKSEYIMLLNNDTKVNSNFTKDLINFLQRNKDAGIIAPVIKFKKDGKVTFDLGGKINKFFGRTTHDEKNIVTNKIPKAVDYVSGCAMLIKAEVFEKIDLFDQAFFLYYEDVDFCLRARARGFLSYILPSVYIEHVLSKSVGKNSNIALYNQTKSAFIFGKKHFKSKIVFNRIFIIAQSILILVKNPKRIGFLSAFKYI